MRDAGKLVVARFRDGRTVAGRIDEFRVEEDAFRRSGEEASFINYGK